jgi:two-component system response regulator (stage 0 sporulation protein F)
MFRLNGRPPGSVVVVADDDDDFRSILAEVLRADGYLVSEARDGAELIEMLDRGSVSPAVIVTDVKMPRWSGLEVLEALNRMHRDVPVVLMTAFSDGSVSAMAGKLCAVGVLHKPFDSDDLLTAVHNARKVVDARRARASSC